MPTYAQANDEILEIFDIAWQPRRVVYENVKGSKPPDETEEWARPTVRHLVGGQSSLLGGRVSGKPPNVTAALGKNMDAEVLPDPEKYNVRRYRRGGVFTAQVFIPLGEGLDKGYTLAKEVSDVYEGRNTPSSVWFRNVRIREIGPDGEWYQFNVLADFEYTEVK